MTVPAYVRCRGCGRLLLRAHGATVNGNWYGPECFRKAQQGSTEVPVST